MNKYKIIKEGLRLEGSKIGDIVGMNLKAAKIALGAGVVELYEGSEPAKHTFIFAEPMSVFGQVSNDVKLPTNK